MFLINTTRCYRQDQSLMWTKLSKLFPLKNNDTYYEKQKTIVKMGVMQSLSEFFSIHGVFPNMHTGFSIWSNMLRGMLPTMEVFQKKESDLFMIGFVRMENLIFITNNGTLDGSSTIFLSRAYNVT